MERLLLEILRRGLFGGTLGEVLVVVLRDNVSGVYLGGLLGDDVRGNPQGRGAVLWQDVQPPELQNLT